MIVSRDVYDVGREVVDRHGPQAREVASDFTATVAGDPDLLMYYSAVVRAVEDIMSASAPGPLN